MNPLTRFVRVAISTVICGVIVVAVVRAQGQADPGTLAGLTREIQLLRQAVEESTRSQSHIQMLSVALSAQQSRLMQVATRLDATRRDLADAIQQAAETRRLLTMFQGDQSTPEDREEAASLMKMFKPQADAAAQREQQLRAREAELIQVHQAEEARWTDLVARLEQSVKR